MIQMKGRVTSYRIWFVAVLVVAFVAMSVAAASAHTVTFDANGGAPTPPPQTVSHGGYATEPTPDPIRPGYEFDRWEKNGSGWDFDDDKVYSDITLVADWKHRSDVTMTFDSNGGSAVAPITVPYNSLITEPAAPTRAGYRFDGWYDHESPFTGLWTFATDRITHNETVHAKWVKVYDVAFVSNGGSAVPTQIVDEGLLAVEPAAPTRAHFTFAGWFTDMALTSAYNFATPVTADVTLYAKWTPVVYTVSFNSNGGSAVAAQTPKYFGDLVVQPVAPTRTGYDFKGWYSDAGLTAAWNFASGTVNGNMTLYAKWEIKHLKVTFDPSLGSVTVDYGGKVIKPATPTRAGYYFGGWFSDAKFTDPWNFASDTITADTVIYAKWVKVSSNPKTGDIGLVPFALAPIAAAATALALKRRGTVK